MDPLFWLNQLIKISILFGIAYLCGLWVDKGVKVNYTRKINHFALFFLPFLLDRVMPFEETVQAFLLLSVIAIGSLGVYTKPVRKRMTAVATMYRSIDRPEDRPYTLIWLVTQFVATFMVFIPLGIYFASIDMAQLIYIPVLINGIGDGLAEPVGIRFGRHSYQTRALFTNRRYTRTLEGSACVLITAVVTVILYYSFFTPPQFIAALIAIPILMTLAEAFSPHTWDSPFLFLVGGLTLVAIIQFI